jgi:CRISPR-associated protein Cas5d
MAYGVKKIKVWGDFACFTRPEMKVERVSYDVITPSAARGILEAIYWKPEIRWIVKRIHVLREPIFMNIRRNEVGERLPAGNVTKAMKDESYDLHMMVEDSRQQRAAMVLKDVEYIIEAEFEVVEGPPNSEGKHLDMFNRRARKGQCFHRPYLGCKEFPAYFSLVEGEPPPSPLTGERDLGWMLYDLSYLPVEGKEAKDKDVFWAKVNGEYAQVKAEAKFFRTIMKDGVIDVKELVEKQGVLK